MELKELQESDRKIIRHLISTDREERLEKTHTELKKQIEDISETWLSQRLNHLAEKGFLNVEKEGRKKYYRLAEGYSEILHLMNTKEKDAEFIRETPVDLVNSMSIGNIGGFKMPGITEYNRADREGLSEVEIDFSDMQENLGEEPSAQDVLLYAAKRNFERTKGVRKTLSKVYDEMAEEIFEDEDKEKFLDAKDELLEVLIDKTEYTEKSGVKVTLPVKDATVTVQGDSLREVYSSVPDNQVFPNVDSQAMEDFMRFFDQEVRESLKSAIVLRNF